MFNEFPKFYCRRIFTTAFTSTHPVDPNPELGESVLHLDTPVYLRSASGKPAENFTEGFNKYCLWLRFLQITFSVVHYSALPPVSVTVIPPTIRTFK
jgi:hypothetical protein